MTKLQVLNEIINQLAKKTEIILTKNIAGDYKPNELIDAVQNTSYGVFCDFKKFMQLYNDSNRVAFLVESQKNMLSKNAQKIETAREFAKGIKEVSVSQYTTLSLTDIQNKTTKYINYKKEMIKMIADESVSKASDEAMASLYELKSDLSAVKLKIENFDMLSN